MKKLGTDNIIKWIAFYFGLGLALYFPYVSGLLPNPDTIWNGIYYKDTYRGEMGLGRWGIKAIQDIKGGVINSSFVTLMALLYLAIISYIITQIFKVSTLWCRVVMGALVICTPNIGSTLTYYYCSDAYLLSYLLSVLAVLVIVKSEWNKDVVRHVIVASMCLMMSIGIYQAYVGITISLCALFLLKMLKENETIINVGKKAIIMALSGGLGIIEYLVATKILQSLTHVAATEARGFSTMGHISLLDIQQGIMKAYRYFVDYFFTDKLLNNNWNYRKEINIVFFAFLLVVIIYQVSRIQDILCKITAGLLICLIPIFFMCIIFMAPQIEITGETGILMIPGMNYIYMLPLLLKKQNINKNMKLYNYGTIVSEILVLNMLVVLNLSMQSYIQYNMRKATYVAGEIVREVEHLGVNMQKTEFCIVGTMEEGNFPNTQQELAASVKWLTADYRIIWGDDNGANCCWRHLINQYIGASYINCSIDKISDIKQSEEVKNMTNFPNTGSVKVVDGVVVIKLSAETIR